MARAGEQVSKSAAIPRQAERLPYKHFGALCLGHPVVRSPLAMALIDNNNSGSIFFAASSSPAW